MGTYLDMDSLIVAVGENELRSRTDRKNTGIIDEDVLDKVIEAAENEVDGYLRGGGYSLPLSAPIDPTVINLATAVFRWYLWEGGRYPEEVKERYDRATSRLKDIKASRLTLKLAEGDAPQSQAIGIQAREKIFTDDNLAGF